MNRKAADHQRQAGAAAQQRRLRSQPGIAGMAVVAEQQGCAVATEEVPKLLGPPGGVTPVAAVSSSI
jgi:hypothetical protein